MNYKPGVIVEKKKKQVINEKIYLFLSIVSTLAMATVLFMFFKNKFVLAFVFSIVALIFHASKVFFNSLERFEVSWIVYLIVSVALVIVLSFHALF